MQRWARRRKSAQALRSRIGLACATGLSNKDVAVQEQVSAPTVGKWRSRFVELRPDGLDDAPRPGRPPSITVEQVEDVVVATLESTPANATHWSRASMAKRAGLSRSTIGRIWKAFELKPHRTDGFKLSNRAKEIGAHARYVDEDTQRFVIDLTNAYRACRPALLDQK